MQAARTNNLPYEKDWLNFWQTEQHMLPAWQFNSEFEEDYLIGLIKYCFLLKYNISNSFATVIYKKNVDLALNKSCDLFIHFINHNYPIYEPDLICYVMAAKLHSVVEFLKQLPTYKYDLHPWLPDYNTFEIALGECTTKAEAGKLIDRYKQKHKIDCRFFDGFINNNKHYPIGTTPFWACVYWNLPDFVLEAFIPRWNINEKSDHRQTPHTTSVLYEAFNKDRYKIVRLLLQAGVDTKNYCTDRPFSNIRFNFLPDSPFSAITFTDKFEFGIYLLYVVENHNVKIDHKNNPVHLPAWLWINGIKTFDLIVNRSKKDKDILLSVLNKDVVSLIRGYLLYNS